MKTVAQCVCLSKSTHIRVPPTWRHKGHFAHTHGKTHPHQIHPFPACVQKIPDVFLGSCYELKCVLPPKKKEYAEVLIPGGLECALI